MKAIINGELYDTDKSEEIARVSYSEGLSQISESLFRSPNYKKFFVARTKRDEFLATVGSSIRLIENETEAVIWLSNHNVIDIESYRKLGIEIEEA